LPAEVPAQELISVSIHVFALACSMEGPLAIASRKAPRLRCQNKLIEKRGRMIAAFQKGNASGIYFIVRMNTNLF
jgi:hypothetical protein